MKIDLYTYRPLIVIISIIFLASLAIDYRSPLDFTHIFMGLFFVTFSMFKFFDLEGFVKGFAKYDIVTQKFRKYGYAYPFLELTLGILYLSGTAFIVTDVATLALMCLSAAGVMKAIGSGLNVRCACLGTAIDVPLSTVSVVENLGMGLMAVIGLLTT